MFRLNSAQSAELHDGAASGSHSKWLLQSRGCEERKSEDETKKMWKRYDANGVIFEGCRRESFWSKFLKFAQVQPQTVILHEYFSVDGELISV